MYRLLADLRFAIRSLRRRQGSRRRTSILIPRPNARWPGEFGPVKQERARRRWHAGRAGGL